MRQTDDGSVLKRCQRCGKLKNDNPSWIAGFEDAFVYGKGQGVEVVIEPMGVVQ